MDITLDPSDDSSIKDVLMCWSSVEQSIHDHGEDSDSIIPELEDMSFEYLHESVTGNNRLLLEKLKEKYPNFIPPSLPAIPLRRRPQPLCTFVNFMGTRRSVTAATMNVPTINKPSHVDASIMEPQVLLLPMNRPALTSRSAKRRRVASPCDDGQIPVVSPTLSPSTPRPVLKNTPQLLFCQAPKLQMRMPRPVCQFKFS